MTAQLSRERLEELKAFITVFLSDPAHDDESKNSLTADVFRLALAGMSSEPVAFLDDAKLSRGVVEGEAGNYGGGLGAGYIPVFRRAAPPAPVAMPDAATAIRACMDEFPESVHDIVEECATIAENACRTAMQAEPVSAAYKLPAKCWCRTCRPVDVNDMRFVVCPECGNKRCPHANDHRNSCSGSNEPGQVGSAYPAEPEQGM